jgi:hypothetical protein
MAWIRNELVAYFKALYSSFFVICVYTPSLLEIKTAYIIMCWKEYVTDLKQRMTNTVVVIFRYRDKIGVKQNYRDLKFYIIRIEHIEL